MNPRKARTSISQLVRETSDDPSFTALFEETLQARRIIKDLMVQRATQHLSQGDIAERMGCTQSRISKLESTSDDNLRLGDLALYADALGLRMSIILEPKELTSVSRIKRFAFQIKYELDKLAALAATDHSIAKGVSDFFGEAFFNLVRMLQDSTKKLPCRPEDGSPHISFHICAEDENQSEGDNDSIALADAEGTKPLTLTQPC
jgi:transcriptional regulator with XRE-family HTH domain